ncbi:hypothetical protein ZIOFF_052094 [Zingiber officinale]|uniref:Leucine-rich repeat-containing N-terminal plant-type domain-containing protein n=1 Tax=Zingiber officinale TaxID=94328 RepID=A0A8J5FUL9_ZINOF|nr:hypothetical protein ZIOFF_052094 [Zingiber officinale]
MEVVRVPQSMPIVFALFFLLFQAREFSCCHDTERQSLLKFKRGITAGQLSSWVGKDCCLWPGVGCNNSTGHIIHLSLQNIGLEGPIPHQLRNLSNLRVLDLSSNSLLLLDNSRWLSRLASLQHLDLSYVSFARGVKWLQALILYQCIIPDHILPSLPHLNFTSLATLDLSYTYFNSTLPGWLLNLTSLEFLYLGGNYFSIPFPDAIENKVFLKEVDLSYNHFIYGDPSVRLEEHCQLQVLSLSWMNMTGDLNQFKGMFSGCIRESLRSLDLGGNQLNGSLPEWLGEFKNLESLLLFSNSFSVSQKAWEAFQALLTWFFEATLSMNNIEGPVPSSMCRMTNLLAVDLSRNHLSKELPNCWQDLTDLAVFDMSSNNLTGVLPSTVYLGSNEFTGGIPSSIGHGLPHLKILILRSNRFHGHIPPQLSNLSSLQILDLSHNSFIGTIPPTFGNFSSIRISPKSLGKIVDVGSYKETILLVTKNQENFYDKLLSIMTTLDLSDNNLSGQIPEQITSLLGLWNLNLSGNHLTGEITHKFSQLIELESLDLSRNQLSGSIPPALSNLTFLSHFNVSYNNLTGSIPSGNQLNTFTDPSAFMGNPFLCGFPLNNSCDKVVTDEPAYKNEIKTHNHDAIWLYISAVLGFVLGFWVVWGVLLFSEASRHSYFRVVDDFFDRVYVSVVLNFRLIKRKVWNIIENKVSLSCVVALCECLFCKTLSSSSSPEFDIVHYAPLL